MDLSEEKSLVKAAQSDPQVFGQLYDQYYPKIFGYILRRVRHVEVAQDVTSETFFKALDNLQKFKWQNVSFSAGLYRIAGNEIMNHYRQQKHVSMAPEDMPDQASEQDSDQELLEIEQEMERHQAYTQVQALLKDLPTKQQEIISLRFFEHKKLEEISQITGKSQNTVKTLLYRSLERIRTQLPQDETFHST